MNKSKSLIFSVLFSILIVSCDKDEQKIKLSGKVLNPNNQLGIENADVFLDHKPVSSSIYNAGYQQLSSASTKSDGSYSLTYEKTRSSDYRIKVRKDDYFIFEKEYSPEKFENENEIKMNFNLFPKGFLKTSISNVSSYDNNDHIVFRFLNMEQQCMDCCPADYIHGYGQSFDTLFVCAAEGGTYLTYEYSVTINNSTNLYGPDSVYVQSFDTTLINIDY